MLFWYELLLNYSDIINYIIFTILFHKNKNQTIVSPTYNKMVKGVPGGGDDGDAEGVET